MKAEEWLPPDVEADLLGKISALKRAADLSSDLQHYAVCLTRVDLAEVIRAEALIHDSMVVGSQLKP